MVQLTIIRDNREQKPWSFENYPVETTGETITTGDYTLAEFCDHDEENNTYQPNFAIERKRGKDFVSSITRDRDRFLNEVKRAAEWECPMPVLIEEPRTTFKRMQGFMQYRDMSPKQIFGTVEKWERYYNVEFHFVGTRERAQQRAYESLATRLRTNLISQE